MAESVQAGPNGAQITPANFTQTFTRDGDGNVTQISLVFNGVTYAQTFTRDGDGNVTQISRWEAQ